MLARERGHRNIRGLPPLAGTQVLAWADAHRAASSRWLTQDSGPVVGAPGKVWANLNQVLISGGRGLPGCWHGTAAPAARGPCPG
jgi:hypothetical protein